MYTYQANLFELQGFSDPAEGDIIEANDFRNIYNCIRYYARQLPRRNREADFVHCDIRKNGEHYASVSYINGTCAIATSYTCGLMFSL